jgi:hypothetical protein
MKFATEFFWQTEESADSAFKVARSWPCSTMRQTPGACRHLIISCCQLWPTTQNSKPLASCYQRQVNPSLASATTWFFLQKLQLYSSINFMHDRPLLDGKLRTLSSIPVNFGGSLFRRGLAAVQNDVPSRVDQRVQHFLVQSLCGKNEWPRQFLMIF